jgi:hypothetical protein
MDEEDLHADATVPSEAEPVKGRVMFG